MACCSRLNIRLMIIKLLHWLNFFEQCLFGYLVFCLTALLFKVAGICNVANIPHFITEVNKVTVNDIKRYKRSCMAEMTFATNSRSTYIHPYMTGRNGV